MNYKYIFFDLDGTLTDSKLGITKSAQYALAKYDIHEPDLNNLVKFVGPPLLDSFKEYYGFDDEKAREAISYFREYYPVHGIFQNELYDGVEELLISLINKGYVLVVATSKPTVFARRIIDYFNLTTYFKAVVGSNLDGTREEKDEVIACAIDQLSIKDTEHIVMIGDRKHDIIGAAKNGVDAIGVAYGYGSKEELSEAKAKNVVESVSELEELLLE